MPFLNKPTEAHKAIISQLLADDAEMRELSRQFVKLGMVELLHQLKRGDAATRALIAKSLAGVVTRAITDGVEDDGDQSLRMEMHEMIAEMRGDLMDQREAKVIVPKKR